MDTAAPSRQPQSTEDLLEEVNRALSAAADALMSAQQAVRLALYAAHLESDPGFRDEMASLHDKLDAGWEPSGEPAEAVIARLRAAV